MARAVYIHIPFCHHICPYCDFNKVVLKGQPVMDYLQALQQEMAHTVDRRASGSSSPITSIFVGGGTPTALTTEQMAFFLQSVQTHLVPQVDDIEFTMEANPGSVDLEKLKVMKEGGVNRLSFGVQSFDASLLKQLGRIHDPQDVLQSIEWARQAGFDNISIDLMFGLPNQTLPMMEETLQQALQLDLPHFSTYSLKVEQGTHFYTLQEKGKLPLPPEDEEVDMFHLIMDQLRRHGYEQYEVSNFARSGFASKHNLTYWHNEEYDGLGAGAHGYVNGVRHVNAGPVQEYIQLVHQHGHSIVEQHAVSSQEAMEEMMIMGLRLKEGVSSTEFYKRYDQTLEDVYGEELEALMDKGLLRKIGDRYSLTEQGIFLGNEVFMSFIDI